MRLEQTLILNFINSNISINLCFSNAIITALHIIDILRTHIIWIICPLLCKYWWSSLLHKLLNLSLLKKFTFLFDSWVNGSKLKSILESIFDQGSTLSLNALLGEHFSFIFKWNLIKVSFWIVEGCHYWIISEISVDVRLGCMRLRVVIDDFLGGWNVWGLLMVLD